MCVSDVWATVEAPYKISTQGISFIRSRSFIRVRCFCFALPLAVCACFFSLYLSVWHFGRQIRFWLKDSLFFLSVPVVLLGVAILFRFSLWYGVFFSFASSLHICHLLHGSPIAVFPSFCVSVTESVKSTKLTVWFE